jgi:hypothetical protein
MGERPPHGVAGVDNTRYPRRFPLQFFLPVAVNNDGILAAAPILETIVVALLTAGG